MIADLDPILHSKLRLSVMSVLISVESAEFSYLLEKTAATKGNLSAQLSNLEEAGYIEIRKSFRDKYPLTTCKITPKGIQAFENYVRAIKTILNL
jgi:DNA-binding MarR family transcriptional regulator